MRGMRWPRSLFARLMLIWLVGIALVLAVSFALFLGERDRFSRGMLFEGFAREIAATVDVLDRMPPADRARWADEIGHRRLRVALRPPPPDAHRLPDDHPLVAALRRALPERRVAVFAIRRDPTQHIHAVAIIAGIQLTDGTPLSVRLPSALLPGGPPPAPPGRVLAAFIALVSGVSLLSWFAVRIATRPLSRMAAAAHALGVDPNRPPMDTHGPAEVAQAAIAFNQMQHRIQEHVAERTRILAAISHDLQTPITRMRLRAELLDDETLRGRFQSDLDAMQALVKEGLDYARSLDSAATPQAIDLEGLATALCEDAADMGWSVALTGHATTPCHGQLTALRRALWNLVENGIKFGDRVEVELAETAAGHEVRIRDHGPGLPDDELEKVFEPFYRTEASRNRETGGTGLGLAIARNLIRAQGGEVRLHNRPQGGLEAEVTLPRGAAADIPPTKRAGRRERA